MKLRNPRRYSIGRLAPGIALVLAFGCWASLTPPVGAAPFDCDVSTLFVSQGWPTQLSVLEYGGGSSAFVSIGSPRNPRYNGIGFNPIDGFLYGVDENDRLLRIDSDGEATDLGGLGRLTFQNAGAIDDSGHYYVMHSQEALLTRVDLETLVPTSIALSQIPGAPDLTVLDGMLWGLSQSGGSSDLVRINPSTGVVDRFPQGFTSGMVTAGAAWTFGNGNLGLSVNSTGTIYQVRIDDSLSATPRFTVVSMSPGPASANNDGAACIGDPADLGITLSGPAQVLPGNEIAWTVTVHNPGPGVSSGYVVTGQVSASVTDLETLTPGCSLDGSRLECVGGVLGAGASVAMHLTGIAGTPGEVVHTATLVGNEEDPDPSDNSATLRTIVGYPPGTCRATAMRMKEVYAADSNAVEDPCRYDAASQVDERRQLGHSGWAEANALESGTGSEPGTAEAWSAVDSAAIHVPGVLDLSTGEIYAQAQASLDGSCGARTLESDSRVLELLVNGDVVGVGSQPLTIPLVGGALHLNQTVTSGPTVIQRALFLDLPGESLDVIIGEAKAAIACE